MLGLNIHSAFLVITCLIGIYELLENNKRKRLIEREKKVIAAVEKVRRIRKGRVRRKVF